MKQHPAFQRFLPCSQNVVGLLFLNILSSTCFPVQSKKRVIISQHYQLSFTAIFLSANGWLSVQYALQVLYSFNSKTSFVILSHSGLFDNILTFPITAAMTLNITRRRVNRLIHAYLKMRKATSVHENNLYDSFIKLLSC